MPIDENCGLDIVNLAHKVSVEQEDFNLETIKNLENKLNE